MNKVFLKCRKFLRRIDAFGSPIKFNIDGQSTYQSSVGGLTTLFMIVVIVILFEQQIGEFLHKDKIYVETSQKFSSNPQLLNLQQNDFMFAIGIEQDSSYPFPNRPYYTIEMLQNDYLHDGQTVIKTNQTIPLEVCTLARFDTFKKSQYKTQIKEQFDKFGFSNFLCPTTNFSYNLQGSYLNQNFQFVTIRIMECVNATNITNSSSPICAPKKAREDYLLNKGAFRLNFYSTNYVINPVDRMNFAQLFIAEDLNFYFQPGYSSKKANIFFRNYEVNTDEAIFGKQITNTENFIYRGETSQIEQTNEDLIQDQTLTKIQRSQLGIISPLTLYLRSDYFELKADRKFMKIDQLLSYFGGIFQLFLLVFGIFMQMFNEKFFLLRMANKLYNLIESDEHYDKLEKSEIGILTDKSKNIVQSAHLLNSPQHVKIQKLSKAYEMENIKSSEQREIELQKKAKLSDVIDMDRIRKLGFESRKEYLKWQFEKFLSKKLKLRTSFSYVSYVLSFKYYFTNNRNKLIDKAITQVEGDMNIKSLMNQVHQIDKLKRLVLSSDQIILFNFSPKPELKIQQEVIHDRNGSNEECYTNDKAKKPIQPMKTNLREASDQFTTRLDYKIYSKLLQAFDQILQTDPTDKSTLLINDKLKYLLGPELRTIFETSQLMQDSDQEQNQIGLPKQSTMKDDFMDQMKDEQENVKKILSQLQKIMIQPRPIKKAGNGIKAGNDIIVEQEIQIWDSPIK